jgi:hypothetical protein
MDAISIHLRLHLDYRRHPSSEDTQAFDPIQRIKDNAQEMKENILVD